MANSYAQQPNVIIIMTDDQGYGDLGCHGNFAIQTPQLNKLHESSVRFTNFHVDPTCAPTRAALMTGKYSHHVRVWHTIQGGNLMRTTETTMAEVFKANGYQTAIFGKWHLGSNYPFRPIDRGFDEWLGSGDGGPGTTEDYFWNDRVNDYLWYNGEREYFAGYNPDVFFDAAIDYIEQAERNTPFFIYLPTYVPHNPHSLPDTTWVKSYTAKGLNEKLATFFAIIERVDTNIGRLRKVLKNQGMDDNTILIFLTDNGGTAGVNFYNAGMRGGKGQVYEGGHRVPCFIYWPQGNLVAGRDINNLSAHIDILPTLVDLCKLKMPQSINFDGQSLMNLIYNDSITKNGRSLFAEVQRQTDYETGYRSVVMSDEWRLIDLTELYNLKSDPGQTTNIAAQNPDKVNELKAKFDLYWHKVTKGDREFPETIIGTDKDKEVFLTSSDLRDSKVWNHAQVARGEKIENGQWHLDVAKKGLYEIEVRRWPREVQATLSGIPDINKHVDAWIGRNPVDATLYKASFHALPIHFVELEAGFNQEVKEVNDSDEAITFRVQFQKGNTTLSARFLDSQKNHITSAYYVYIAKK
ncbi:MAG: arylsulfatase [Candidatus Cyclobacteriaceae bacterium M3_2C_046]